MNSYPTNLGKANVLGENIQGSPSKLNAWRSLLSEVLRSAVFPLYQTFHTPLAFHHLRELRKLEFASRELIQTIQRKRLAGLLLHAIKTVPYYRDRLGRELQSGVDWHDLTLFPILNKAALKKHFEELISEDFRKQDLMENASGGSTGKPVQFYQHRAYWEHSRASQWFVESWWGIRPGDRTASVWGCDRDVTQQTWREHLAQEICQVRMSNAFAVSKQGFEEFARMLLSWRPRFITGYASALELFARFLLENPKLRITPHAVKSTAEALTHAQRSIIERAFQCPVYNFYGSREVNNLAAECPAHSGLHVNALTRYVEIVDENGQPLPPGIEGRILVTDLTNLAMPFIRYDIEDIAAWSPNHCSCGRPFPLLSDVLGRSSDFISVPGGKIIHGEFFTHLFYDIPQAAQFRLIQTSLHEIRVEIVLQPGISGFSCDSLLQRLRSALGYEVKCEIDIVQKIERATSGKHRFTVSTVRPAWSLRPENQFGQS